MTKKRYLLYFLFFVTFVGNSNRNFIIADDSVAKQSADASYGVDGIKGDPQNGVKQLKRFYTLIQKHRELHNGNYPADNPDLLSTVTDQHEAYGFLNWKAVLEYLSSPDDRFDDLVAKYKELKLPGQRSLIPVIVSTRRADGSDLGSIKTQGTHDVLATVTTYQHRNYGKASTEHPSNPVGFYLTLWDDGSVIEAPYDDIFFVLSSTDGSEVGLRKVF